MGAADPPPAVYLKICRTRDQVSSHQTEGSSSSSTMLNLARSAALEPAGGAKLLRLENWAGCPPVFNLEGGAMLTSSSGGCSPKYWKDLPPHVVQIFFFSGTTNWQRVQSLYDIPVTFLLQKAQTPITLAWSALP